MLHSASLTITSSPPSTSFHASPSLLFPSADPMDEAPSPTTASSSRHEEVATPTFASIRDRNHNHNHDLSMYPQPHDSSAPTYADESAQSMNEQMDCQSIDSSSSTNLLSQSAVPSTPASPPNHRVFWSPQNATVSPYPSGMTLPVPSHVAPRVHPHLGSALYINSVPPHFKEESLAEILRDCLPVRISLSHPVPLGKRIMPNIFYEWMPQSGLLQFDQLLNMERALATLPNHPIIVAQGIVISPYPSPYILPFPAAPTPARQIRPCNRVQGYEASDDGSPTQRFMAQCPSPGELFDVVRPWGSVRSVSVWIQPFNELSLSQLPTSLLWAARVEFWYEDEAQRFDIGFGQTGSTIKGWQLSIASEFIQPMISMPFDLPDPYKNSPSLLPTPETCSLVPPLDVSRISPNLLPNAFGVNSADPNFHMPSTPATQFPHFAPTLLNTPPSSEFQLPWSNYVRLANNQQYPLSPPHYDSDISMSAPATPVSPQGELHSRMSSHGSMSNLRDPRREVNKKWQVALDPSPSGGLVATGLVSDDGKFIPHGPGQHIRPAPVAGPGSRSSSGLVDYANIYVKNLDPDINSAYLAELFDHTGKIISARVMRDERGASRGFGFVSFRTPDDASQAIRIMNNAKVGTRLITVSLHEPRMVRPDKIAERVAKGEATFLGRKPVSSRRSSSPTRTDRRGRLPMRPTGPMPPGTTDDIRLLSPKSRTIALVRRVKPRVEHYATQKGISKQYFSPTVDALVSLDLGLIPLLHDASKLDDRIAEIVDELRDDPESIVNLKIRSGSRPKTNHALSEIELAELRVEIERIDPLAVEVVTKAMLEKLTVEELRHCLDNKSKLAIQYGVAKRSLITADDEGRPKQGIDPAPADPGASPGSQQSTPLLKVFLPLDIDNLTISKFVSLSINDMALHLSGQEAGRIIDKLAINRPTPQALAQANAWTAKVMAKGIVERKAEIAAVLAKMLDVSTLKRSQKTKVARNLVNAEDNDEAICELMRYPELLDAKVRSFMEKEEADGRGVDVAT